MANVTAAYAELAALEAEIALLEQQQKVAARVDETFAEIKATPGRFATEVKVKIYYMLYMFNRCIYYMVYMIYIWYIYNMYSSERRRP